MLFKSFKEDHVPEFLGNIFLYETKHNKTIFPLVNNSSRVFLQTGFPFSSHARRVFSACCQALEAVRGAADAAHGATLTAQTAPEALLASLDAWREEVEGREC